MQEKKEINIEIGQRIKLCREKAGLTQEAFAERMGLGDKHISAIERGVVGVSLITLKKVCQVLSVSADLILLGEQPENDRALMADRLSRLSPEQFRIAEKMLNALLEGFTLE